MIYFSGHGSFIPDSDGDEVDQRDEVLLLHDSDVVERNGRKTLVNALVDDRFAQLLKAIPSDNIVVLVDACHSGISTRSLHMKGTGLAVGEGIEKFFSYRGMPATRPSSFGKDVVLRIGGRERFNYVLLSAADEDEKSIAGLGIGRIDFQHLSSPLRDAVVTRAQQTFGLIGSIRLRHQRINLDHRSDHRVGVVGVGSSRIGGGNRYRGRHHHCRCWLSGHGRLQ